MKSLVSVRSVMRIQSRPPSCTHSVLTTVSPAGTHVQSNWYTSRSPTGNGSDHVGAAGRDAHNIPNTPAASSSRFMTG